MAKKKSPTPVKKKSLEQIAWEEAQEDEAFAVLQTWVFANFYYQANGQGNAVLYTFVDDEPKVISSSGAEQLVGGFIYGLKQKYKIKWVEEIVAHRILLPQFLHHVHDVRNMPTEDKLVRKGIHLILNEWRPHLISNVEPSDKAPERYVQFMEMIFPDKAERKHVETWFAVMAMRPHWQLRHGLILRSVDVQGVGKDMLIERIVGECILGKNNFKGIALRDVTTNFNAMMSGQRLIHLQELYRNNIEKSEDALKPLITNEKLRIEEKYKAAYMTDFYGCFVISTNQRRPMILEPKDRRWFVPADMPKPFADDQDKHNDFFHELLKGFRWENDAEILASYYEGICRQFQDDPEDIDQRYNHAFDSFSNMPPITEAKKDLFKYDIRGEQIEYLKAWLDGEKDRYVFRMEKLKEGLAERKTNVLMEQDVRDILSSLGFNYEQTRVGRGGSIKCYIHPLYKNGTNPDERNEWTPDREPFVIYPSPMFGEF